MEREGEEGKEGEEGEEGEGEGECEGGDSSVEVEDQGEGEEAEGDSDEALTSPRRRTHRHTHSSTSRIGKGILAEKKLFIKKKSSCETTAKKAAKATLSDPRWWNPQYVFRYTDRDVHVVDG